MRDLGLRKWLCLSLTAAFLILLLCFLLFHYSEPVEKGDRRRILLKPSSTFPHQYHSEREKLVEVLRRATMSDRTVILTMLDGAWANPGSILEVFLQSFKVGQGTEKFLNHLVIITMDTQAFEYCRSLHRHCIHPSIFPHYSTSNTQSTRTPHHNMFSWKRNHVLLTVLELGYNIIFTDADVMWLSSPLSHFHPLYELTISCDFSNYGVRGGYVKDGGLFFLKANIVSFELVSYWDLMKVLHPNSQVDKSLCSTILQSQDVVKAYGFRVQYVNTSYFGEFCQLNRDILKDVYTMHANCCNYLRSKIHDLTLVLDDWINFRARLSDNYTLERTALRWRAPLKCLR